MGEKDEPDDEEKKNEQIKFDRKDYIALVIAALETVFLPLLILVAILLVLVFLVR